MAPNGVPAAMALFLDGGSFFAGHGVPQNYTEAERLFRQAG
jgi:TPR repeat protein